MLQLPAQTETLERLCSILLRRSKHYDRRILTEIEAFDVLEVHPKPVIPLTQTEILRLPQPNGEHEVQTLLVGVERGAALQKLVMFRHKDLLKPGQEIRRRLTAVKGVTSEEVLRLYDVGFLVHEAIQLVQRAKHNTTLKLQDHSETLRLLQGVKL